MLFTKCVLPLATVNIILKSHPINIYCQKLTVQLKNDLLVSLLH